MAYFAGAGVSSTPAKLWQGLKYRWVTDIVRSIREIVRRKEEPPDILSDVSETKVYCLSDPSVLHGACMSN